MSLALALAGLVLLRALILRVLILALSVIAPRLICVAFLVLILPPALALGSYLVHFYAVDHDESSLCRREDRCATPMPEARDDRGQRLRRVCE